jgi:hypothetical protein
MNGAKFTLNLFGIILAFVFTTGCSVPTATSTLPPNYPPPLPLPTSVSPAASTGGDLFTFVKEVKVTPIGNFANGDFVRIGYVPGKGRIVVTFRAKLNQPVSGCNDIFGQPNAEAIAYIEYTMDMEVTGDYRIITCQTGPDVGGMFLGNDYYYATMGHDNVNNMNGWWLAKYNAISWDSLVSPFFYTLSPEEGNGDPMIAMVNGQIDVSGKYRNQGEVGPGHATHHQFFTPDLQFISKRILSDAQNIDLTSLLGIGDVINFVTSTDLWGDMIVIQYDASWNFLSTKTIKVNASAPEGLAFDGQRYYISYIDNSLSGQENLGKYDNVHLAAFDMNWNLLDDIAVTNFVPDDHMAPARPSLTLQNNRIYVCYDQGENVISGSNQAPEDTDIQVHVKVYEISQNP